MRLYDPALGEYLPTGSEKSEIIREKTRIIEAVKAERDAASSSDLLKPPATPYR